MAQMNANPRMARRRSNEEQETLPWRKRVTKTAKNKAGKVAVFYKNSTSCVLLTSITTLVSCAFFVLGTYMSNEYAVVILTVEAIFAFVFLIDYVLSIIAEAMWLSYVLSFEGFVDLLSIFPVFGAYYNWLFSLSFVRYLRLGKVTRVMRNHRLLDKIGAFDEITVNACLLGLKITGLILMTTAIIYGTEEAFRDTEDPAFSDIGTMDWHDALYYTIVTLSTVGYGDVLPVQVASRMLMIMVILVAFTYVPLEVGNLVNIVRSRTKNRTAYPRHLVGSKLHVVLAMVPGDGMDGKGEAGFNALSLIRIIEELFHEDHGVDNESLLVVVMAPCLPSPEVLRVIRSPRFMSRVVYYRGSVMDPVDMKAVCAEYADCIFLYPCGARPGGGLLSSFSVATEENTTLAAKSLQRYLNRTPTNAGLMSRVSKLSVMGTPRRTLVTVKELSSKEQLLRFGINHVICHDELKMSILACATLFPAFLPFAINAMGSSSDFIGPFSSRGEKIKHHRSNSSDLGGMAAAAAATADHDERRSSSDQGGNSVGNSPECPPMWLYDYKRGMEYEVYSLALNVKEDSRLLGTTFSRAALALYKDSDGEVLLMAVVHDLSDSYADVVIASSTSNTDAISAADINLGPVHSRIKALSGVEGEEGARAQTGGKGATGRRAPQPAEGVAWTKARDGGGQDSDTPFMHATIFPGDDFQFVGECSVLLLAESKSKAEHHLMKLQKSLPPTELWRNAVKENSRGSPPRFEEAGKGGQGGGKKEGARAPAVACAAVALSSSPNSGQEFSCGANLRVTSEPPRRMAALVATSEGKELEEETESIVVPRTPLAAVTAEEPPRLTSSVLAAAEAGEEAAMAETAVVGEPGSERLKPVRRMSVRSWSSVSVIQEEERTEQMEAVRDEMRSEDGARWKEALEALTAATEQLDSLKTSGGTFTEARIAINPKDFFSKVQDARFRLDDALRVQAAAVPEDLEGHLVIIGAHPRLQYYVVAMRRKRPDVAIVVVTADKESFFELRERIAEAKCEDAQLNITKIFSVTGKSQNRTTFDKARVANSAAVLLVSNEPSDSAVLLVSFELEQVLRDIPPGQHVPKVLIDLQTDNSIYYCSNTLGRGGSESIAHPKSGGSSRLIKEMSGSSAAGVWEWPLFAAGMVWTESIMEVFAVQTYFSAEFLAFLETLLQIRRPNLVGNELGQDFFDDPDVPSSGGENQQFPSSHSRFHGEAGSKGVGKEAAASSASTVLRTGQFDMLPVASRRFLGKRYDTLVQELILKGAMPLGLYRPEGTKGSLLPYTQVNPNISEHLVEGDVVFVLRSASCCLFGSV